MCSLHYNNCFVFSINRYVYGFKIVKINLCEIYSLFIVFICFLASALLISNVGVGTDGVKYEYRPDSSIVLKNAKN